MASRSAALCFSAAAVATTTSTGGRSSNRGRLLAVCCDSSRKSDLGLPSSLAAKVLGAPTTFDAAKLTVQFAEDRRPAFPRAYTLSHCDFTANLTLAVSATITSDQLRRWGPDDVFAEWKQMAATSGGVGGGEMTLNLHCLVSGRNPLQGLAAGFRYYVFSKELPLVLKAVLHGDGALFADRPELMDAQVSWAAPGMKKKSGAAGSSIFSLWEKASKAKKTDETCTPNQTAATSSSSPVQPENNLQLALVQTPDAELEPENRGATPASIIEDDEAIDEEDEQTQAEYM